MNPNGISADMTLYLEESRIFYLGETEADGYSQAVQFELKGNANVKLFFNDDDENINLNEQVYKIFPQQGKFKLKCDDGFQAIGPWTNANKFQNEEFRSYVVRLVFFLYNSSVWDRLVFRHEFILKIEIF